MYNLDSENSPVPPVELKGPQYLKKHHNEQSNIPLGNHYSPMNDRGPMIQIVRSKEEILASLSLGRGKVTGKV